MLRIFSTILLGILIVGSSGTKFISPFGIVEGITDCGSRGVLGTVEVTDCTLTPCHFVPETIYDVALRFTASVTSENLILQVVRAEDGTVLMGVTIDGVIEAGIEYELTFKIPVTAEFDGARFHARFYIFDLVTSQNEICAEAAVTIGW